MNLNTILKNENIIIYGAGAKGKLVFQSLYALNMTQNILGFAVSNDDDVKDCFTKNINQYTEYSDNSVVILAAKHDYQKEMIKKCRKLKFKNVVKYEELQLHSEYERIYRPYHYEHFLLTISNIKETKMLDVGCGNNSIRRIRKYCSNVYYTGLDIGDYNLEEQSKKEIDEYVVVDSDSFANEILRRENCEDVVISSHNIEHCEYPIEVIVNMTKALRGGWETIYVISIRGEHKVSRGI